MASEDSATKVNSPEGDEEDTNEGSVRPSSRSLEGAGVAPGYSQLHWMKLIQSNDNLSGIPAHKRGRTIPMSEVAQHCTSDDAWTVLGGRVFNITPFVPYHPGGKPELMRAAGKDATALFEEVHPWVNYETMLASCYIGHLNKESGDVWDATGIAEEQSDASSERSDNETISQSKLGNHREWQLVTCVDKQPTSADGKCFLFRFSLESEQQRLGLRSAGQHILVRPPVQEREERGAIVAREYTPVSPLRARGYFELAVKTYDNAKGMTKFFRELIVGKAVEISGPYGELRVSKNGVKFTSQNYTPSTICLVGGGSGVTPILQILQFISGTSALSKVPVFVLCVHKSANSAMLMDNFRSLAQQSSRFHIGCAFTRQSEADQADQSMIDKDPIKYMYKTGHISASTLERVWPKPEQNIFAGICGTPDFCRHFDDVLRELYYPANNIFVF